MAALLVALLSGCLSWPQADAALLVFNETGRDATIEISVFDRNGVPVHHDRVAVPANSMAEGVRLDLPAGSYSILARSDDGRESQHMFSLDRGSSVQVWVTADGERLGLAVT